MEGLKKSLPERYHNLLPMNKEAILRGTGNLSGRKIRMTDSICTLGQLPQVRRQTARTSTRPDLATSPSQLRRKSVNKRKLGIKNKLAF